MPIDLDAATRNRCLPDNHVFTPNNIVAVDAGKAGVMYKPVCTRCGERGRAIAHALLKRLGVDLDLVKVVSRRCICVAGCELCSNKCEYPGCGTYEMTHQHHYWPKAIWGSDIADRMPTGYLCQQHHTLWHQKHTPIHHGRAA